MSASKTKAAPARPVLKSAAGSFAKMPPNPLLSSYLDEVTCKDFVDSMAEVKVKQGEVIMRQGDKGNNFYLIKSGECEVTIASGSGGPGATSRVRTIGPGGSCGELSLLTENPRSATVTATSSEVTLLMVNRRMFKATLGDKVAKKRTEYDSFLSTVSLLEDLSKYERCLVADALKTESFQAGDVVVKKNAAVSNFYMIQEGEIVAGDGNTSKTMRSGEFFGEVELLKKAPSSQSYKAKGFCTLLTVSAESFVVLVPLHCLLKHGAQIDVALADEDKKTAARGRRYGESAEATTAAITQAERPAAVVPKSAEATKRIRQAIAACKNMVFSKLDDEQLKRLEETMKEHKVKAGDTVIQIGEKGNNFYVVDQGDLDIWAEGASKTAMMQHVRTISPGESFGELSLMYNCPRTATIKAKTNCVLWSLDRQAFRRIVLTENHKKMNMYEGFLKKVELLSPLSDQQRNKMVDALEPKTLEDGEVIIQEDTAGEYFYIIEEGSVEVTKGGASLATRGVGDYFGEVSLRTGDNTMATVTAKGTVKLVRMDRGAFTRILGPLDTLLAMRRYSSSGTELSGKELELAQEAEKQEQDQEAMTKSDFSYLKASGPITVDDIVVCKTVLGQGAFGKVRTCCYKGNQFFALKSMDKSEIISMGQVEHILQESQILDEVQHPYITNKFGGFKTDKCLYLLMEICPGGDMFDLLYRSTHFSVDDTRIYCSQILLALECMHNQGIVHRDLKLENILVAADGSAKLTDFGFAKHVKYRTWTLCGTPEYLAPEIILERGHGKAVDYWALGVLVFEMCCGHSPFEAEDHLKTYEKILDGKVNYPAKIAPQAKNLVHNLLQKDITRRFGNMKDGTNDIKNHALFNGFDWSKALTARATHTPDPPRYDPKTRDWFPGKDLNMEGKPCSVSQSDQFKEF